MTAKTTNHGIVMITGASVRHWARARAGIRSAIGCAGFGRSSDRPARAVASRAPGPPSPSEGGGLGADLSDERDIEALRPGVAEQAGPVDVLMNNAGSGYSALFDRSDCSNDASQTGT